MKKGVDYIGATEMVDVVDGNANILYKTSKQMPTSRDFFIKV